MNEIFSRLTRTMSTYFRIGIIRLKDNSAVLDVRNAGDTAYIGEQALYSQAVPYTPTDLSVAYTIPASHQTVIAEEFTISGSGSLTIAGAVYVVS